MASEDHLGAGAESSAEADRGARQPAAPLDRVPGLGPVVWAILWVLDPSNNPSGVVYGLITVGAVIAAESAHPSKPLRAISATVVVIILYWLAHSYATVLGRRLDGDTEVSAEKLAAVLVREWGIVRGAMLPVLGMLLCWAAGGTTAAVEWVGFFTAIGVLVIFEIAAGVRSKFSFWGVTLQALIGISFGVGLLLVRSLLA